MKERAMAYVPHAENGIKNPNKHKYCIQTNSKKTQIDWQTKPNERQKHRNSNGSSLKQQTNNQHPFKLRPTDIQTTTAVATAAAATTEHKNKIKIEMENVSEMHNIGG